MDTRFSDVTKTVPDWWPRFSSVQHNATQIKIHFNLEVFISWALLLQKLLFIINLQCPSLDGDQLLQMPHILYV